MNDENIVSITQLKSFLKEVAVINFTINNIGNKNKQEMYDWVGTVLTRFKYFSSKTKRKEKHLILDYIQKISGRSRPQIKRLVKKKKEFRKILLSVTKKNTFPVKYSTTDIARLIETDNAHGRLSGPATKRIMEREYEIYGKINYEKISKISIPHIYNFRKNNRQYKSAILFISKTQAVKRNIGERKKPQPEGKPGYLRVDSVHQGDLDKEKGVYYINMVDEVTQWEIIGCVEGISEQFLEPLLIELLERFPFKIINFHSDNGSEYINYVVKEILNRLLINQTKSRSRRSNDNALVETKNGSIVRKHMGFTHIPKDNAKLINNFLRKHFDDYLNFHRPCGFATTTINEKGKETKKYDQYMTPYEKFRSLDNPQQYLKPDIMLKCLDITENLESDNESAQKMQKAKSKLFQNLTKNSPV